MKPRKFKTCFITGITGSGGSYLAEKISEVSPNTRIFGSYRSLGYKKILKKRLNKIKLFNLDLNDSNRTYSIIKKVDPDVVFHFASNADVRDSFDKPLEFASNNNSITINVLEALKKLKSKAVIIICSTSEVYGRVNKNDIPIKENQKFNPSSPYAATKAFQDFIAQIYYRSFKMNIIITRMFSYTNARRKNLFQTSFANQIIDIESGRKNFLYHGNLNSIRTFIDIDDAMNAYWFAATKGKIGEIYNIGGNKIISVKDFLNELINRSKKKIICKVDKKLLRPIDVTLQITNSRKFRKDTGWKPKVSFSDSVNRLIEECQILKKEF